MFKQASEKRVAVFVAPGLEEIEGLTVVDLLFRAGVPCDTVAITPDREVTSSHEVRIVCKRSLFDEGFSFADLRHARAARRHPRDPQTCAPASPLCAELSARAAAGPAARRHLRCAPPSILAELRPARGGAAPHSNPGSPRHVLAVRGAVLLRRRARWSVDGQPSSRAKGAGTADALRARDRSRHLPG